MLERLELLVGKDTVKNLKNMTVLVIGVGGVGGYAVEALVRSGVGSLILVDPDTVSLSNLNRQIIALHSSVGQKKIDVWKERILDINPECKVCVKDLFLTSENMDEVFNQKIDFVIDACDTISTKKEIIKRCIKEKIRFVSSMGTGKKKDPSKLSIMDIRKTSYDPIAKVLRKMVKDERIKDKIMVVCSTEQPKKIDSKIVASNAFVPACAGLLCASYIVNEVSYENSRCQNM